MLGAGGGGGGGGGGLAGAKFSLEHVLKNRFLTLPVSL